jgi:hypothetical protein
MKKEIKNLKGKLFAAFKAHKAGTFSLTFGTAAVGTGVGLAATGVLAPLGGILIAGGLCNVAISGGLLAMKN